MKKWVKMLFVARKHLFIKQPTFIIILCLIPLLIETGCHYFRPKITVQKIRRDLKQHIETRKLGRIFTRFGKYKIKQITILEEKFKDDEAIITIDLKLVGIVGRILKIRGQGMVRLYYDYIGDSWRFIKWKNLTLHFKEVAI